ncbi:WGR domain-containing protein [Devosia sp. BK]|uniref:WGR domain-containing protein n=1 Tax=Devosia sp. BK TaxID=2871706 RepID=UPI002939D5FB|nr:WGR domain-containing protein [Devosia sp. BK]MDV3253692.1 WGR domain-containing protein [Devosia sp. BK]
MSDADLNLIYLERIDASRNMARFYYLMTEPDLFGRWSLVRRWGRIGSWGHERIETFDTGESAKAAGLALKALKLRRHYVQR